jgi:hypothetical protein
MVGDRPIDCAPRTVADGPFPKDRVAVGVTLRLVQGYATEEGKYDADLLLLVPMSNVRKIEVVRVLVVTIRVGIPITQVSYGRI